MIVSGGVVVQVQPGSAPFTTVQRVGALAVNGGKLLAVGTVASLVGVGAINALMGLRQQLDPGWVPLNPPQNIVATSLACARRRRRPPFPHPTPHTHILLSVLLSCACLACCYACQHLSSRPSHKT